MSNEKAGVRSVSNGNSAGSQIKKNQGPDFICIGMQKAATGWLYDQLRSHVDFWMPPVKELHYFDGAFNFDMARTRFINFVKANKTWDERVSSNWEFFRHCFLSEQSVRMQQARMDFLARRRAARRSGEGDSAVFLPDSEAMKWYGGLFNNVAGKMSGDITPAYSTLRQDQIEAVHESFPLAKIILLIRHPVDRVWSQLRMRVRRGSLTESDLGDKDLLADLLKTDTHIIQRAFASEIYKRWSQVYGKEQMGVFFFDEIARNPDQERIRILQYLGASCDPASLGIEPGHNKKSAARKQRIPEPIEATFSDYFAEEIREIQRLFGGAANQWRT